MSKDGIRDEFNFSQLWEESEEAKGGCLFKENFNETPVFAFLSLLFQRHRGDLFFNLGTFDTSGIASGSKIKPQMRVMKNWGSTVTVIKEIRNSAKRRGHFLCRFISILPQVFEEKISPPHD